MPCVTPADLPIAGVLPDLRAALAAHPLVVLQAPPGAGKSTQLPLDLLHEPWLAGQSVVMLQPRRVAARAVATRLAEGLGEEVGGLVGSRVRFESRVSARTRIEVVTEGILTRRLQRDPELGGVGLVILDEFHERSLNADLALALLREVQGALRDDLRVLIMSATLDPALPERLNAPLVRSEGRAYPVELHYLATDPTGRVEDAVARAVLEALTAHPQGDLLAFLPGVREIRGAMAALSGVDAVVLPLYGDLPLAEQRRALVSDPQERRKVVLATSIAETSLTLAGVQGARLPEGDALAGSPALAVAHLDAGTGEGRVYLAAPLDRRVVEARADWQDAVRWDARSGALVAQRERRVGALVLETRPLSDLPHAARVEALAGAIREGGLHLLTFSPEAAALRARAGSLRSWRPGEAEWPDLSDAALLATLEDWLGPHLAGVRTRDDLGRVKLLPALQASLPWPLSGRLDDLAPTHLTVPSGSRVRLAYQADGSAPILAVKLQELFGLADTPAVNGGRTPVLLHLLSPAGRPVQITQDLRSFWNSSYFEVRRDLRGRYPKHPWPDDPWTHAPTRLVKRRL
jgi:HrpA-like RNA helicase